MKNENSKQEKRNDTELQTQTHEQNFLGSLLSINPDELPRLTIQSFYFHSKHNGLIFQAFFKQLKNGIKKPDINTLSFDPDLRTADVPISYISSLTNIIPSGANILFYEEEIIKAWQTRTAKYANEQFKSKLESEEYTGDIEPLIREYMGILSGALSDKHSDSFITFEDYINTQARKEYWREYTPKLFGSLPFPDGTISTIGAAPGGGKSAALINLCRELLTTEPTGNPRPGEREKAQDIDAQRKILFISAEMSTQDLTDRLIHSLAWQKAGTGSPFFLEGVPQTNKDYWKALKYNYGKPPDHWEYSREELQRAKLYKQVIEDYIRPAWGGRLKIAYVRGRKCFDDITNIILNNAEPGTLVLMDYLQLMPICNADIGQGNPRYLEIRHIMDMGIIAAEKTQSVIISAAQLGREDRRGGSKGDDTQGWRESGDIEQTAWNLIKMLRDNDKITFKITKARSSAGVGTDYNLKWIPGYQYMEYGGKLSALEKTAGGKTTPESQEADADFWKNLMRKKEEKNDK
jgi:replicative DNA helicase